MTTFWQARQGYAILSEEVPRAALYNCELWFSEDELIGRWHIASIKMSGGLRETFHDFPLPRDIGEPTSEWEARCDDEARTQLTLAIEAFELAGGPSRGAWQR